jgi:hypothetical protein
MAHAYDQGSQTLLAYALTSVACQVGVLMWAFFCISLRSKRLEGCMSFLQVVRAFLKHYLKEHGGQIGTITITGPLLD